MYVGYIIQQLRLKWLKPKCGFCSHSMSRRVFSTIHILTILSEPFGNSAAAKWELQWLILYMFNHF